MGRCPICLDQNDHLNGNCQHLVITKSKADGHIHVHGDLEKKEDVKEMLEIASQESGVAMAAAAKTIPQEIVFHNRQRIGDMLMFTCAVRDFKAAFPAVRVNVISVAGHIFDHNPNVDRTLIPTPENTIKIGPGKGTNASNRIDWHFANAFRISMEDVLGIAIPQGESRPDIYLTQEEYDAPRLFEKPYWVICTSGEKGWGCKMYPHSKWQEVVDQNPDLLFVQIGTAEDNAPRLQGSNVVDYIGKTQSKETGIRDLFKLFLNAEGSIGLVSFHMHLSGALSKPCVVVAGAREPVHFTRYPGHAYLATDGMLPCATKACWHCDIKACTNPVIRPKKALNYCQTTDEFNAETEVVPKCVDMISSEDVSRALNGYYEGGRLTRGVVSPKMKFKNIVPTPPPAPETAKAPGIDYFNIPEVNTHGLTFGGGALTDRDWLFIKTVCEQYGVKQVLEFGAGLSTLLFADFVGDVLTFETHQGWIAKINTELQACGYPLTKAYVCGWKGDNAELHMDDDHQHFDLAFVDGPAGGLSREHSTRHASELADLVIVHDAGREHEKTWQEKYLKEGFFGPIKGGHRCHLWVKKSALPRWKAGAGKIATVNPPETRQIEAAPRAVLAPGAQKFVKIVSTARGWGGCARSVTTIMRLLLQAGHRVEFIPFRNTVSSREFKAMLAGELKDVIVTEHFATLSEPCDALLVYADDYVWEFGTPEMAQAFAEVNAERRLMMLNYRRGKVGEIPWTREWDKYIFLNSTQEAELLKVHPGVATRVLPPCVDLEPFFAVQPDYENGLRIVRHSSQGDTKFGPTAPEEIARVLLQRKDVQISMLPGPSTMLPFERFNKVPRTADPKVIAAFLATGNLFWYSLPVGYMDMGPRVILEAMAAGLPIMADNWGGAIDRVTPECGWLVKDKAEYAKIVSGLTVVELRQKGEAARARARAEFVPENWLTELVG